MRHFTAIFVAALMLTQAAFGQDSNQSPKSKDGNKSGLLPPPTLVAPPAAKTEPGLKLPPPGSGLLAQPQLTRPQLGQPHFGPTCPGPFAHFNGKTVVFVANGVDSTKLFDNLRTSLDEVRTCVCALNVPWARYNQPHKDHLDKDAQRAAAYKLACTVLAIRQDAPTASIVFMAHSTGTAVVLGAAEMLPPASIDRIFLFSSSLSTCYYLRPALSAARGGIDNFYSRDDGILECVEDKLGTADGHFGKTAGRCGFVVPPMPTLVGPEQAKCLNPDVALYGNLRQVCWSDDLRGAGHGGHSSFIHECFLKRQILPQLAAPRVH